MFTFNIVSSLMTDKLLRSFRAIVKILPSRVSLKFMIFLFWIEPTEGFKGILEIIRDTHKAQDDSQEEAKNACSWLMNRNQTVLDCFPSPSSHQSHQSPIIPQSSLVTISFLSLLNRQIRLNFFRVFFRRRLKCKFPELLESTTHILLIEKNSQNCRHVKVVESLRREKIASQALELLLQFQNDWIQLRIISAAIPLRSRNNKNKHSRKAVGVRFKLKCKIIGSSLFIAPQLQIYSLGSRVTRTGSYGVFMSFGEEISGRCHHKTPRDRHSKTWNRLNRFFMRRETSSPFDVVN